MQRSGEAIVLNAKSHGENSYITTLFSKEFGKVGGLLRAGKKNKAALQPMSRVKFDHMRRLPEQLGSLRIEALSPPPLGAFTCAKQLKTLNYLSEILNLTMAEDEPHPNTYNATTELLKELDKDLWHKLVLFEIRLLKALGYGLSLTQEEAVECPKNSPLCWVSPNSGRAVSQHVGTPYSERLLTLPHILGGPDAEYKSDMAASFKLTGFFLEKALQGKESSARNELIALGFDSDFK